MEDMDQVRRQSQIKEAAACHQMSTHWTCTGNAGGRHHMNYAHTHVVLRGRVASGVFFCLTADSGVPEASPSAFTSCDTWETVLSILRHLAAFCPLSFCTGCCFPLLIRIARSLDLFALSGLYFWKYTF